MKPKGRHQVNMALAGSEFYMLSALATEAGGSTTAYARELLIEAMRRGIRVPESELPQRSSPAVEEDIGQPWRPKRFLQDGPSESAAPPPPPPRRQWTAPRLVELSVPVRRAAAELPGALPSLDDLSKERRRSQPAGAGHSVIAALMGDPPPGRSALDQKR